MNCANPTTAPAARNLRDYTVRVITPNQCPLEYVTRSESACDVFEAATERLGPDGGRISVKATSK